MKKIKTIFFLFLLSFLMVGCKKSQDENDDSIIDFELGKTEPLSPTPTPTIVPEIEEEEVPEGHIRSYLTGLWVPEEIGTKRPYAIQFSNFKSVSNQWGIEEVDILYEAIVEGGITRLLGVGENITSDRIGSIRSSRHYYASLADEYDAIYIHFGKTKYAVAKLKELGINNLDGETGIGGTVFYRDKSMKAPHNAFTSKEKILAGIKQKGFETQYQEGYEPHFQFYNQDRDLQQESSANKVTVKFSPYTAPYLEYNAEDKLYYRFQFGGPHKDSNTGNQLAFKNIIIQFVKQWDIDRNDYQTMELEDASGTGYYITNGSMVPITWKKNESKRWMRYYDENGEELTINAGKTFIAIFPNNRTKDVLFE